MKLDIADVAFQGFRLVWKKPLVVLAWALAYTLGLVVVIVGAGLMLYLGAPDASTPFANPLTAAGGIVFFVVGFLLLSSMLLCAAYRAVLRPDAGAFAYLRLSMTELRMSLLLLALVIIAFIVALIMSLILGIFLGMALGGGEGGPLIASLIAWAVIAFLSVRFSLTGVVNFAEGRFGLVESWEITRGNFWRLFAVYLILIVYFIVISLLGSFLGGVIQAALGAPNPWAALMSPAAAPASGEVSPVDQLTGGLAAMAINILLAAINTMVLYAPHAAAYRALTMPPPETTSDVFS